MKRIKTMKKVLAVVSAMALMLGMTTTAFAAEKEITMASKAATYQAVIKEYAVNGATIPEGNTKTDLYPTETLSFTSVADTTNPDTTNLTIADLTVNGNSNQKLTINVPSYTKVGTYHYTISETAGSAQGVTYTSETILVSVMVTYDYDDADDDGYGLTANVGITGVTELIDDEVKMVKDDTLTNTYDVGSLSVTKEVTGNMGDKEKYFDVTVTFTADAGKNVESAITITGGSNSSNPTVIASDWTGAKSVDLKLKHGDTVTFSDIPAGVTYTVEESDKYSKDTNVNGENGYDAPTYTFSDTGTTKTISKEDTDTVKITNNKNANVDTGIHMDSLPYIVALALVLGFVVVMIVRRRRIEE